jgi:hypothetical protein
MLAVMKKLLTVIFALIATISFSQSMPISELKNLPVIEVVIIDEAKNACWTNLTESREYAEEKLRSVGATLYDNREKFYEDYYMLAITVLASRNDLGPCVGMIDISLYTGTNISGRFHYALARTNKGYFVRQPNGNQNIIEAIQSFFTDGE